MLQTKIQELLKRQRRTVKELAAAVGISDTAIRNIYKRDSCEISTLKKIAEFFGVTPSFFIEEEVSIATYENSGHHNPFAPEGEAKVEEAEIGRAMLEALLKAKDDLISELKEQIKELKQELSTIRKSP